MHCWFRLKWLMSCVFCILILFGVTQDNTRAESGVVLQTRPKIGLALGGGSAAGFSHIGVLIWLEEHHIPVDYIVGTSMGGLIAGCYAMGMNAQKVKIPTFISE